MANYCRAVIKSLRGTVTHINHIGMAKINGPESTISGKEIF
jgi:hypothetical protein